MNNIYIIAGEASGDMLGAGLMQEIKSQNGQIAFAGIGGELMQEQGLQSLFAYSELSIMGFVEVVPHIRKILQRLKQTCQDIENKQPQVVITIDSPGFNFRLAKMLRKNPKTANIKLIHYVAPSVWAYKPKRAAKIAKLFDQLLCLLPFEPAYFEQEGLQSIFVGHQSLWQDKKGDSAAFRSKHNLADSDKLLLVLPGSRRGEVAKHLEIFLEAAKAMPSYKIAVLAGSQVKDMIAEKCGNDVIICDFAEKFDAFAASEIALSKSGTITLELAYYGIPTIVAHKAAPFSAWLIRKMLLIDYVSLVNIAENKEIFPELLQEKCTPQVIIEELKKLGDSQLRSNKKQVCEQAIEILKGGTRRHPNQIAARAVLDMIT